MNNQKVKKLRKEYKQELNPEVDPTEVSAVGTHYQKLIKFNKNEFKRIKRAANYTAPAERSEKNKRGRRTDVKR